MKNKILNIIKWGLLILTACTCLGAAVYYSFKTVGDTATMVAGLWSAIATVVLGAIALFQSHRYKKLSERASEDMKITQNEIKNLTKELNSAVKTLQNIEKAKYYPDLEDQLHLYLEMDGSKYKKLLENENLIFQLTYLNLGESSLHMSTEEVIEKYNVFAFELKNIGEKTIRNFMSDDIEFDPITKGDCAIYKFSCDIKEGQSVIVALINFPELKTIVGECLNMKFEMQNLIGETYTCSCNIYFYNDGDAKLDFFPVELSGE